MAENKKVERIITTEHKHPSSTNKGNGSSKQEHVTVHREGGKIEKRSSYSKVINESAGPSGSPKK